MVAALQEKVLFLFFLLADGWNTGINNAAATLTHQKTLRRELQVGAHRKEEIRL